MLGIEVEIKNVTLVFADFEIRINEKVKWQEMRMNFLITTRKDLEYGSVRYSPDEETKVKDF